MSVPSDRMAPRTGATMAPPSNKIMGLPKWAFWVIIVLGLFLAYYLYKRSQSSSALSGVAAGTTPSDTTNGLTAADIGGTPADNSFATTTDEMQMEEQIQSLENSIAQLNSAPPGSTTGAGIHDPTTGNGVTTVPITNPVSPGTGTSTSTVPTQGITPDLTTGNGIGNSPTALQNLYAAGIMAAPQPGDYGSVKVPGGKLTQ